MRISKLKERSKNRSICWASRTKVATQTHVGQIACNLAHSRGRGQSTMMKALTDNSLSSLGSKGYPFIKMSTSSQANMQRKEEEEHTQSISACLCVGPDHLYNETLGRLMHSQVVVLYSSSN